MTDMVSSPNTVSSPRVKKQATIWEPLQNNEVMKDAKCTIGNEISYAVGRYKRGIQKIGKSMESHIIFLSICYLTFIFRFLIFN
jgi:hypothetical protein